jgi:hypothetical protein
MRSLLEEQERLASAIVARNEDAPWGVRVHRNNVFGNLAGALADAYPIVRKIVGADFFKAMAHEYARQHPSTSGDLNEYGVSLPGFLRRFPHTLDLPYLPDVARMEWIAHLAHYAPEPEPLGDLPFRLAAGSAPMRSDWPLARLWEVHQDGYHGEINVDFAPGPHRILVYRPAWRVAVQPITLGEYRFIAGARRGEPLGELLEATVELDPAFEPAAALARLAHIGVLKR